MAKIAQYSLLSTLILAAAITSASAGELVYQPVNPSFGGYPGNSAHLLGIASAIDKYKDPSTKDFSYGATTQQDEFSRIIRSSILSRVASQISEQIYGENAQDAGRVVIDDQIIEWNRAGNDINLTLSGGGGTSVITIPRF
ncbi:curli assembly protein CsgF [Skermanella rosea]|nr:curli assembly protein CsgF [Skermanella rosea]UEM03313.1 curli assembly protein CsgF [Skermanella rosea]